MNARTLLTTLAMTALLATAAEASPLGGVMFRGVTAYTPEDLMPLYQDGLGRPVDAGATNAIIARLDERYRQDGYLEPEIGTAGLHEASGVLVINVREPHVAKVRLGGREHVDDPGFWTAIRNLKAIRPLTRQAFATWLVHAGREHDMSLTGELAAASAGSADYVATLRVDRSRVTGFVHMDNRAPAQIGHELVQGRIGYRFADDRLGHLKLTAALAADPERLRYVAVGGTHRVGARGQTFAWQYSTSTSTIPHAFTGAERDYERERTSVSLSWPLKRTVTNQLTAEGHLHWYDLDKTSATDVLLRKDRIRSAELTLDWTGTNGSSRRQDLTFAVIQGLDTMGARLTASTGTPDPDFLRLEARYRLIQRIGERWRITVDMAGQVSEDHLPSSERFLIGGRRLGGAFDPASVSGDEGVGIRTEIAARTARVLGAPLEAYAYYDHGFTWSNNEDFSGDEASSAGAGLRLRRHGTAGYLEIATPIVRPETNPLLDDGTRVFLGLTQRF